MKRRQMIFAAITIALAVPVLAWANMAIPIENPVDHYMVFDNDSGVRLVEETVAFSFEEDKQFYSARVNVSYVLINEEAEDKSVDMIFVTPPIGESGTLEVRSGGHMIETAKTEPFSEMPKNWKASERIPIVDPLSGEILDNSPSTIRYGDPVSMDGDIWGTRFSVDLPTGDETTLEVAYDSESGFYRYQNVINNVFSQIYYLTPAGFYEGKPEVTLKVSFPEGSDMAFHSNIPMKQDGGNFYIAELDGIPEDEWFFTFADKSGLFLGTNKRALNNYPVLAFCAFMVISAIWFWKSKKRKGRAGLFLLAGACSLLLLKPSYGSLFLLYMASPLIAIAFLIFAAVWIAKRVMANKRKL
ncbi:MAG: hypothetical protein C0604_00175 [Clostridiales bacterium]|nr:MAG: hypothetical protein C0604_00175 [Clostridiales bacterium]